MHGRELPGRPHAEVLRCLASGPHGPHGGPWQGSPRTKSCHRNLGRSRPLPCTGGPTTHSHWVLPAEPDSFPAHPRAARKTTLHQETGPSLRQRALPVVEKLAVCTVISVNLIVLLRKHSRRGRTERQQNETKAVSMRNGLHLKQQPSCRVCVTLCFSGGTPVLWLLPTKLSPSSGQMSISSP